MMYDVLMLRISFKINELIVVRDCVWDKVYQKMMT